MTRSHATGPMSGDTARNGETNPIRAAARWYRLDKRLRAVRAPERSANVRESEPHQVWVLLFA